MAGQVGSQEQGMGSYRYAAAEGSWQWSDGIYIIHGFRRGEVVPSTALLLAHAHSADRRHTAQLLESCLRNGELFSFLYRLINASGQLRWALIAGEGVFGRQGQVTGLRGYLIDVTEPHSQARSREVPSTLRKAITARAVIEQAKGALMLVYGLDAGAAFAVLSWQSQHANIKLRELAERLVDAVGADGSAPAATRQRLDEIIYRLPAKPAVPAPADRPDADERLTVEHDWVAGAVLLRLRGEIDMSTGPRLDQPPGGSRRGRRGPHRPRAARRRPVRRAAPRLGRGGPAHLLPPALPGGRHPAPDRRRCGPGGQRPGQDPGRARPARAAGGRARPGEPAWLTRPASGR